MSNNEGPLSTRIARDDPTISADKISDTDNWLVSSLIPSCLKLTSIFPSSILEIVLFIVV